MPKIDNRIVKRDIKLLKAKREKEKNETYSVRELNSIFGFSKKDRDQIVSVVILNQKRYEKQDILHFLKKDNE